MSVQRIPLSDLPKSTRNRTSPIKQTRDWKQAVEHIRKQDFEALRIEFAPTTLQLGKRTPLMFKRLLGAELKKLGLGDKWRTMSRGKVLYVIPVRKLVVMQASGEPAVVIATKVNMEVKDFDDESESQPELPRG
jgi:hypothetical protein